MAQSVRTPLGEDDASLEQAIDAIFIQLREADERIKQRQIRIDRLREETKAIIAEIKAMA